ncbi:MAG: CfrBI family restriction endonuclease, partial [Pseudomonadota bacterium]
ARDSTIFVADKLSDLNKKQLNELKVNWVELRNNDGYKKFSEVLEFLKIPHNKDIGIIENKIDFTLNEIFCKL